ncbi:hypothetical protein KEM48_014565 [Puccinia striiformis f. sp. tritici PST-130]|nr:hypothetical protein KEM48_014565 [Puccinia striiformis f. sp. tritici PST-130]
MPATRSSSPLKRTTRTAFANNRQILPVYRQFESRYLSRSLSQGPWNRHRKRLCHCALAASITSQGISVDELAVVQASLASELAGVAVSQPHPMHANKLAHLMQLQFRSSFPYLLTYTPTIDYQVQCLARLIAQLSLLGPSAPRYCQLCRNDVDLPIALLAPLPNTKTTKHSYRPLPHRIGCLSDQLL